MQDKLETILFNQDRESAGIYLTDILLHGCTGWKNQTSVDLEEEFLNRFSQEIKIK